jgi:hypothetical protein
MASKFHSNRLEQYSTNHFGRTNRRKTNGARHTQVIDVPKYIINPIIDLSKATVGAKIILEHAEQTRTQHKHPDLFIQNPSPWAGKRKFIFHDRPNATA